VADLRPDRCTSPRQSQPQLPKIYWTSGGRERFQGVLDKSPENFQKHRAASRTVTQVLQQGLFLLERTETFPFRYHFQNLSVLEQLLRTSWRETFLRPSICRRLQMIQRSSRAGHIVVIESLRLTILRKC
jgi:hypothetical protein